MLLQVETLALFFTLPDDSREKKIRATKILKIRLVHRATTSYAVSRSVVSAGAKLIPAYRILRKAICFDGRIDAAGNYVCVIIPPGLEAVVT
jgi:hypothetical protein